MSDKLKYSSLYIWQDVVAGREMVIGRLFSGAPLSAVADVQGLDVGFVFDNEGIIIVPGDELVVDADGDKGVTIVHGL